MTQELDRKNKKITDLESEIADKAVENNGRYEKLLEAKRDMENMNKERIKQMVQAHEIEIERRRQDYSDKMDADQQRYNELEA